MLASYKVAYRVAKCKKAHLIAQQLILSAAVDIVNIMTGESAGKLLSKLSRRIQRIGDDLNIQLIEKLKGNEVGLQLDEVTDSQTETKTSGLPYQSSSGQLSCPPSPNYFF